MEFFFSNTSIEYHNYNERYWFTINQHISYWVTQKNPAEKTKYVFSFRTVNMHQVQNIYWWYKPYHWCHHSVPRRMEIFDLNYRKYCYNQSYSLIAICPLNHMMYNQVILMFVNLKQVEALNIAQKMLISAHGVK